MSYYILESEQSAEKSVDQSLWEKRFDDLLQDVIEKVHIDQAEIDLILGKYEEIENIVKVDTSVHRMIMTRFNKALMIAKCKSKNFPEARFESKKTKFIAKGSRRSNKENARSIKAEDSIRGHAARETEKVLKEQKRNERNRFHNVSGLQQVKVRLIAGGAPGLKSQKK